MNTHAAPLRRVIFAVVAPVRQFFRLEAAGGLVLIGNAILALALANSPWRETYERLVHASVRVGLGPSDAAFSIHALVNDGLMTAFFLIAGLEIKREIVAGELRTLARAALPLIAAAGGMVVPALVYLTLNPHAPARTGWAIPTATDIAFALGCLSLVRKYVPWSLFVFLTALAIFDDLGAIAVITIFYGGALHGGALLAAALLTGGLVVLNRSGVGALWPYVVLGLALWVAVGQAGLHPALAGVLVGVTLPASSPRPLDAALTDLEVALESLRQLSAARAEGSLAALVRHVRSVQSPAERMLHALHASVAFGIVPLFALVNAGVSFQPGAGIPWSIALGVAAGLVVGKAAGVFGATFAAVRLGLTPMPSQARWLDVLGVSIMAGVGFTMSLFVAGLAFADEASLTAAKVGIVAGSLASAAAGMILLRASGSDAKTHEDDVAIDTIDVPRFADDFQVTPWNATGPLVGMTLREASLRSRHGITVLGVWRVASSAETSAGTHYRKLQAIDPGYALTSEDTLLLVGEKARVKAFLEAPELAASPVPGEPLPRPSGS